MDFRYTPEQDAFRHDLRQFLEEHLTDEWHGIYASNAHDTVQLTRDICVALAERGWLTMSWPKEFGGSDGDLWSQMVLREEMWAHGEPRGPQYMNLNYIGPMIMRFGNDEQKARFLPPMAAGSVIWTQGFSEPGAGSDLASLRTRADDQGDHFIVNGQKIWNSYADSPADWCLLLVRTSRDKPRHKGISVLLVDMTSPGVTVRPIQSMGGLGEINEIFFEDVVVPKGNMLGEQDGGWPLIMYGLSFERTGIATHGRSLTTIEKLIEYVKTAERDGEKLSDDPVIRAKIAELYCRYRAARLVSYRVTSMVDAGKQPEAEASIAWILGGQATQEAGRVGMEIVGWDGLLREGEPGAPIGGAMEREWIEMIPMSIGAGTVDIQRSIVAQRGLGLPKAG